MNNRDTVFRTPIAEQIWKDKYQLKEFDGTPIDLVVQDTWQRVASSLASVESDAEYWEKEFYGVLQDFKFIPAGRIVAGAGSARDVTLFNCFVMGTIPDDLSGIFAMLQEAAITMQKGGGIGYDFSTLRPKGA
jgi:ribonucleoside-diphosphate reductase alpha chain